MAKREVLASAYISGYGSVNIQIENELKIKEDCFINGNQAFSTFRLLIVDKEGNICKTVDFPHKENEQRDVNDVLKKAIPTLDSFCNNVAYQLFVKDGRTHKHEIAASDNKSGQKALSLYYAEKEKSINAEIEKLKNQLADVKAKKEKGII